MFQVLRGTGAEFRKMSYVPQEITLSHAEGERNDSVDSFGDRMVVCPEMFICGALRARGSYDVWIYVSARRGLTAHPHLKHFLHATVYSQPELNFLAANSGIHRSGCAIYSTAFEAGERPRSKPMHLIGPGIG
jgi:hypothetical protein